MADIINFEPIGGVSPGYAYQAIQALINAAWNKGLEKDAELSAKITAATSGFLDTTSAPTVTAGTVTAPTVTAPGVIIPPSADVSDVISLFDQKYVSLMDALAERCDDFIVKFFPNEAEGFAEAQTLLKDALAGTHGGISDEVYASLLEQERSRVLDEASRASDAVLSAFAARRFPVPPGAAVGAVAMIQQKAQGDIAEGARKLSALSIEMQKFTVEKLLTVRNSAMASALDYIKSLAAGPELASRVVNVGYDAQSKLITSAADFYRANISAADLTAKVNQFNVTTGLEAAIKNQGAELALIEDKLKALLAEAGAIAQEATALFNNVHAGASASGS